MCASLPNQEMRTDDGEDDSADKEAENPDSTLTITGTSQSSTHSRFIPLPRAKSKVWKYFVFEADDSNRIQNSSIVFCQVPNCNARIGYS